MQAFPDLGAAQMEALWEWMEAVVEEGPALYAP